MVPTRPAGQLNYRKGGPGPVGRVPMGMWSATRWLIIINVVVFVADLLSFWKLTGWGAFSVEKGFLGFQVWRWITYQFLHGGGMHILFNMIGLYFFGPLVENFLGRWRFVIFYLVCGIGGAGAFCILWVYTPLHDMHGELIGASGSIFGVLAACAVLYPNVPVGLIFTPVRIEMKWLVAIFVGLAFVEVWSGGFSAGGPAAHLGGAVMGLVLIYGYRWLPVRESRGRKTRFWKPGDPGENLLNEEFRRR